MNGYNLLRAWYNFKFDNPSKAKAIHSDMYCYLIDLWNRLGQKSEFGLPTSVTMEALGIGSYNTYKKTLNDLIEFGFIMLVVESKNQHQSKIVALSNIDKATDKPLDKAHIKATDTINKQYNNITNKQLFKQPTIEQVKAYCLERNKGVDAERWFNFYVSKGWLVGKTKMKDWKASVRTWEKETLVSPINKKTNDELFYENVMKQLGK